MRGFKRYISFLLIAALLFACVLTGSPKVYASPKTNESRAIAIVFDNSGSMYYKGNQAWCRATYAMEVFASMLNAGDVLQIYPMWEITAGSQKFSMEKPLQITDAKQASVIRDIFTEDADGTPIESIDCAVRGLQAVRADNKYLIVLTDGDVFYENGDNLRSGTKAALDKRIQANAGEALTVMYLGIGADACMPDTAESDYFVKKKAANSADVLSTLTVMCNQIFGRDTLPKNHISGNTMEFDISMSKLIVFVQGENISNLKIAGGASGKMVGTQQTQYSTKGAGNYDSAPDTSLQGMMVTYTDCPAGSYTIDYTGTATSIEVYYEPDADLDFVFTDANGNTVDPNALYEGDYKVSFGMKDARTGKLIASDLLGNPRYQGSYFIDGKEYPITHEGFSGSVDIPLKMGEKFAANLTATYLSGYTISKDASDFGWPEGGIQVAARPAGELKVEISGGEELYSLQDLEKGASYAVKVYYKGVQLTGSELERVELKWDPDTSNAEIKQEFADDHFTLKLHYKDPAAPQDTGCGECTVPIFAFYTEEGSSQSQGQAPLTYNIKDDFSPLQLELQILQDYIVISEMKDTQAITVNLLLNGAPLSQEEFANVALQVDCSGIEHTVTADPEASSYTIQLLETAGIAEGDYPIRVTAQYTDHIGRVTQTEAEHSVTLSRLPLWAKWLICILLLLFLIWVIWRILHIRVLPKLDVKKSQTVLRVKGDQKPITKADGKIDKGSFKINFDVLGKRLWVQMNVTPGRDSYLYKPNAAQSALVDKTSVKAERSISEVTIRSTTYRREKNELVRESQSKADLLLQEKKQISCRGTIISNGRPQAFDITLPLCGKKK